MIISKCENALARHVAKLKNLPKLPNLQKVLSMPYYYFQKRPVLKKTSLKLASPISTKCHSTFAFLDISHGNNLALILFAKHSLCNYLN